ncbi:MAG: response regulator [Clostridia bacterium]|nr:response regulator [Clostridia bacterium]
MMKVLLIDDEEIIREGLKKIIDWGSLDCEIIGEAEDGEDGIKMINSLKPDIVFTDIRMPGLDGLQMISNIKDIKEDCKIIILSGFRDFEYAQEAVKLGAFRFLLKPSKPKEISQTVKDAVDEIKKIREKEEQYHALKIQAEKLASAQKTEKSDEDKWSLEDSAAPETGEVTSNAKYLVSKAKTYMHANYKKDLNLKVVAEELYISTWYLSKLLKKETGKTFIDILNEIRIKEAIKLLNEPRYKIYKIAEEVGFTDVPYFYRLFKKLTGMTPIEYKNRKCEK